MDWFVPSDKHGDKTSELKRIINAVSWRVEDAPRIIKKLRKPGNTQPDPSCGLLNPRLAVSPGMSNASYCLPQLFDVIE